MDGPTEYHTKQSNSERQLPYDGTYMWNLKYDVNEPVCETEAESYIRIDWQLPRLARGGS